MSPEQVRAQELDRRSDIFAIGILLYELLTGERLFTGESDLAVLDRVRAGEILAPSTKNAAVPAELDRIALKALARDIEVRYQYASEMSEDLQRFLITSDSLFTRKDLAGYMLATFPEEVERERARLAEYADIRAPSAAAPPPTLTDSRPSLVTASMGPKSPAHRSGPVQAPDPDEPVPTVLASPDLITQAVSGSGGERTEIGTPAVERATSRSVASLETVVRPPRHLLSRRLLLWLRFFFHRLRRLPSGPVSLATATAALGLVALLAGLGVLASSHGRPRALLCVEAPAKVEGKVTVRINDELVDHGAGWPILRFLPPGRVKIEVSAEGFKPFEKEYDVMAQAPTVVHPNLPPWEEQAMLVVVTNPADAEIHVEGKRVRLPGSIDVFVGESPVGKDQLVEVFAPGFPPFSRHVHAVSPNDTQVVMAELKEAEDLTVRATSTPDNATVLVNGKLKGHTPVSFKTSGGTVKVTRGGTTLSLELQRPASGREPGAAGEKAGPGQP
jgi:hypothetical protein